jgi:hypothetical protein
MFGGLVLCAFSSAARAEDWPPVTAQELQMTSEPKAPGAPALYLYRLVDRDDNGPNELVRTRIKILTDAGLRYAQAQIAYDYAREEIGGLAARTIHPDGSIVEFDGVTHDDVLSRTTTRRALKTLSVGYAGGFFGTMFWHGGDNESRIRSFTFPDVRVGSILDLRYRRTIEAGGVYDSRWLLSSDLYTRYVRFALTPHTDFQVRWSWPAGLPPNASPPESIANVIRLEARDLPALVIEDHAPPDDELKYRVDFLYDRSLHGEKDPERFWKAYGKARSLEIEQFIAKRRALERALADVVHPRDAPEERLAKVYRRVTQLRNLSFEPKTSPPERIVAAQDAEEVWQRGYGTDREICWLFLALVRVAGLEADAVLVPRRDVYFFNSRFMNPGPLDGTVIVAKVASRELYLDPGTPWTPLGLLPWPKTAVPGLRLEKSGARWIHTPLPAASESRIERTAALHVSTSGSVEGKATVTYTGLEALSRRLAENNEDEASRKHFLEEQLQSAVPAGTRVVLTNSPAWQSADAVLVAQYDLRLPDWAVPDSKRALVPVGLFAGDEKHTFEQAERVNPMYFEFPTEHSDEVRIDVPAGWKLNRSPESRHADLQLASYRTATDEADGTVRVKRDLTLNLLVVEQKYYRTMQDFFETVRAADTEQVVLSREDSTTLH